MDLSLKMVQDLPGLINYHYKEGNFNWPMIIYVSLVHITALAGVAKLTQCSAETLIWAFALWPIRYVILNSIVKVKNAYVRMILL